jgi:two-component system, NarL family, response regulator NreC
LPGLLALLGRQNNFEIIAEAENGRDAVALSSSLRPDVVIMDVGMPLLNSIEAIRALLKQPPSTGVVILSMYSDESYVMRSLQVGGRAYLLKDSTAADLLSAIDAVSHGRSFFSPAVSRLLAED